MYFKFDDLRPDTPTIEGAISRREGVLLSIIVHLIVLVLILTAPRWLPEDTTRQQRLAEIEARMQQQQESETPRFVFVQPRLDVEAPRPPARAELSDRDRVAQAPQRAPEPRNPLPFARGNTPERVEAVEQLQARNRPPPAPEPSPARESSEAMGNGGGSREAGEAAGDFLLPQSPQATAVAPPSRGESPGSSGEAAGQSGGVLGEAIRNLQRYVQHESFDNPSGGAGQFGPSIQFDTKGVEFGPWIRRFIAQIKRNWFIPYAAMVMKGHVVITFNVHKDGAITDLAVAAPSAVDAFNNAAFNALAASNPTHPLPSEYPADRAFFTVTFYYNESPPTP
jgi:TonB family protein